VQEIRIIHGEPTAEEAAAVVAVLVGRRAAVGFGAAGTADGSRWRASARPGARAALRPGPGAWRASGAPA
jgi:hypothetical protein